MVLVNLIINNWKKIVDGEIVELCGEGVENEWGQRPSPNYKLMGKQLISLGYIAGH